MCSSNFYHMHEGLAFFSQCVPQQFNARKCYFHQHLIRSDVHGCWKGIIGGLGFVDIIIGMKEFFLVTQ